MKKKLFSRKGFTMIELLAGIVVLVLICSALGAGIPAAVRVYREASAFSEADVLASTISAALMDELRFAREVRMEAGGGLASYTSGRYAAGTQLLFSEDGRVYVSAGGREYPLVSEKTYTSALAVSGSVSCADGLFTVSLLVRDGEKTHVETEFQVAALNP